MGDVAIFTNKDSEICDFFESSRFLVFRKVSGGWRVAREARYETVAPTSPARTRAAARQLLPLIAGCDIVAGGALFGIPYTVFDQAGLHIFEIGAITDDVLDEMCSDVEQVQAQHARDAAASAVRPTETRTPGFYELDLIEAQSTYPELSSKKILTDFLENTPFLELHLRCKHVPPWIENSGAYCVQQSNAKDGAITAIISKQC
ncbi:MAG: hypothetical protein LBC23_00430 [Coriobacteriales bacterium]|jgi:hypothetical protein|nr:hypothetical protein [Coriobacteriales bacterium]